MQTKHQNLKRTEPIRTWTSFSSFYTLQYKIHIQNGFLQIQLCRKKKSWIQSFPFFCCTIFLSFCHDGWHLLSRQATRGSAASLGSRYTSWGCSLAGVIARCRHSLLMYCTNATSITKLHFREAFWAWRVSIQVHLKIERDTSKDRAQVKPKRKNWGYALLKTIKKHLKR